jgi:hypothetical protein
MRALAIWLALGVTLATSAQALDGWQPLPAGETRRIAFGSCAKQWEPQPIWNDIADAKGVLLLSGNVHFAELSVWKDGASPLY